jgi:hypothetical protein
MPKAVTTTSDNWPSERASEIVDKLAEAGTVWVVKPAAETVNWPFSATLFKVKLPEASACVAVFVPVTVIVANGTGLPTASRTVPDIVRVCPNANAQTSISTDSSDAIFLM